MAWEQDRRLVKELAWAAVARAAPKELPQFAVTADAFFAAPSRARRVKQRDDPLGLGLDSVVVLTSTAALSVAVEVLKHVATDYSEKALGGLWRRARSAVGRRVRSDTPAGAPLPRLTEQQLAELHALARQKALAARLPSDLAELLADGIIAELARRSAVSATTPGIEFDATPDTASDSAPGTVSGTPSGAASPPTSDPTWQE